MQAFLFELFCIICSKCDYIHFKRGLLFTGHYLPDLLCGLESVHHRHIAVHEYKFIILSFHLAVTWLFSIFLQPASDCLDGLSPVECPLGLELEGDLEHGLQGHDVEHVVVHHQDVAPPEARTEKVRGVCRASLEGRPVLARIQGRQVLVED